MMNLVGRKWWSGKEDVEVHSFHSTQLCFASSKARIGVGASFFKN